MQSEITTAVFVSEGEINTLLSTINQIRSQELKSIELVQEILARYRTIRDEKLEIAEKTLRSGPKVFRVYFQLINDEVTTIRDESNQYLNLYNQGNIQQIRDQVPQWSGRMINSSSNFAYMLKTQETVSIVDKINSRLNSDSIFLDIQNSLQEIESAKNQIFTAQRLIADESAKASRKEQVDSLKVRAEQHEGQEKLWFNAFIVVIVLFGLFLSYLAHSDIPLTAVSVIDIPKTIHRVAISILFISALGVAIKVCLNRYLSERAVKVMYLHRISVIQQYPNLETGLANDTELKNSMRLELAKFIFSDPGIGSAKDAQMSDININPIIHLMEKASDKITK